MKKREDDARAKWSSQRDKDINDRDDEDDRARGFGVFANRGKR